MRSQLIFPIFINDNFKMMMFIVGAATRIFDNMKSLFQRKARPVMKVICPHCLEEYKINPRKIPSGVSATKCRTCMSRIPLTPIPSKPGGPAKMVECKQCGFRWLIQDEAAEHYRTNPSRAVPHDREEISFPNLDGGIQEFAYGSASPLPEKQRESSPKWRRMAFSTAVAGVILVVFLSLVMALKLTKDVENTIAATLQERSSVVSSQ